ncbi:MAG TPA: efflux RND transporter periplasmic adaptor subunit [Candidatus Limnocylindrales bacterium]|nr:efflux RND transporter periplasmic adaptor subunit [Candidatus Limnocylindrales bacterium]
MAKGRKKWAILSLVAGLGLVVLLVLASRGQAPSLTIVKISRADLNAVVTSNGKVEPISPTVARAGFPTFVDHVYATEGQAVHRGELILTLDAADVKSQLAQMQAQLLTAQADLRNAKAGGPPAQMAELDGDIQQATVEVQNLERTQKALKDLVAKQAATQDELAQNEADLTKAQAKLEALDQKKRAMTETAGVSAEDAQLRISQAQDQVRALREKVKSATVIAPMDGTLYSLPVRVGDYVQVGQMLAQMADLRHVRVRAFVDEPDLGWLGTGQSVDVTWDAKPGQTWTGETEQIPKQVVARESRSVGEVLCSVDNSNRELLPNVNVEVRINVRERKDAVVVPRAAVRYDKGQHYVFLFDGSRIHRQDISVGIASATNYEVLSGLKVDDRVALPGDLTLRNGMDVRAAEEN